VLDLTASLTPGWRIYWVNAVSLGVETKRPRGLARRDFWDRSYGLWMPDSLPLWVAGGMLNSGIYGGQAHLDVPILSSFPPLAFEAGYTFGDASGLSVEAFVPLLPQFSGVLRDTHLFAEGGLALDSRPILLGHIRQGSAKRFVQIGSGYDFRDKAVMLEATVRYSFGEGWTGKWGGVKARLYPNLEHRLDVPLYVYRYDVPIYFDGNSPRRLHNFPWRY
jgi:hypothetical protein